MTNTPRTRPIPNSYVVPGTAIAAGEYPGAKPDAGDIGARAKLAQFLDAGVTAFIDLTETRDGLAPYASILAAMATERALDVTYERLGIRDVSICPPDHMSRILGTIEARIAEGRFVYVHCWGGVGRTGTVVGCWLVRQGRDGDEALRQVQSLFDTMSPEKVQRHRTGSPETDEQRAMVRGWHRHDGGRARALELDDVRDRHHGALLGLAVGDALGTTLEFTSPGEFTPITDMVGGGPFRLAPGQWTDDTSMALCLAESLAVCGGFDALDQMTRYVRWWREGHWSSTGRCFDIGGTTSGALRRFTQHGDPYAGDTHDMASGNGSLMRLAPIPMYFRADAERAMAFAADSSRTTHGGAAAVDACRYFAGLVLGAMAGVSKGELLSDHYTPVAGAWDRAPLHDAVAEVAAGSFRRKSPPAITGGRGYVIDTLEAALWAFATTDDFASGALAAVNLGGDADTTGAVYGQIAGAFYGRRGIPAAWLARVAKRAEIEELARRLY